MDDHDIEEESLESIGNDIVFDCEHCGKSLVIDVRGAGLKIQCPECKGDISVPIPEGIELSDIDDYSMSALPFDGNYQGLDEDEAAAGYGVAGDADNALLTELEELRFRAQFLEKQGAKYKQTFQDIDQRLETIRMALKEIDDILADLIEKSSGDTQELE